MACSLHPTLGIREQPESTRADRPAVFHIRGGEDRGSGAHTPSPPGCRTRGDPCSLTPHEPTIRTAQKDRRLWKNPSTGSAPDPLCDHSTWPLWASGRSLGNKGQGSGAQWFQTSQSCSRDKVLQGQEDVFQRRPQPWMHRSEPLQPLGSLLPPPPAQAPL